MNQVTSLILLVLFYISLGASTARRDDQFPQDSRSASGQDDCPPGFEKSPTGECFDVEGQNVENFSSNCPRGLKRTLDGRCMPPLSDTVCGPGYKESNGECVPEQ